MSKLSTKISNALIGLTLIACTKAFAENPPYHMINLASGQQIKVLTMGPVPVNGDIRPALKLRYQTNKKFIDKAEIAQEVGDIWKLMKNDADKAGYSLAIICVDFSPVMNKTSSFMFEKDVKMGWQCLNNRPNENVKQFQSSYANALQLTKLGHFPEALVQYDKCIAQDPNSAQAYAD